MTIRVVLAEDYEKMRETLREFLAGQEGIEVAGEAADAISALRQARLLRPDVVLMDTNMRGGGETEATRQIRAELPEVQVVAVSFFHHITCVQSMLDAGACGYVINTSAVFELVPAIECAAAGKRYLSPEIDQGELRQ